MLTNVRRLWANPKFSGSFSSAQTFLENRKLTNLKGIEKELRRLEAYTIHRGARKRFQTLKVRVPKMSYQFGADLMDMSKFGTANKGKTFILVVQDLFSKKIWLEGMVDKSNLNVVKAFKKIFKRAKVIPALLQTGVLVLKSVLNLSSLTLLFLKIKIRVRSSWDEKQMLTSNLKKSIAFIPFPQERWLELKE